MTDELTAILDGFVPEGKRLAVKPHQAEEVRESGLVIPQNAQERPNEGTVIGVSEDLGQRGFAVGDSVVYSKYGGVLMEQNGEQIVILSDTDVLLRKPAA